MHLYDYKCKVKPNWLPLWCWSFPWDPLFDQFTTEGVWYSMLTHAYPHKLIRKIKVAIARLRAHFAYGLMGLPWLFESKEKECGHTWHWISLLRPGVIKQHKTSVWSFLAVVRGIVVGAHQITHINELYCSDNSYGKYSSVKFICA